MKAPVPVLLVMHAELAGGLMKAAASILGSVEGVDHLSNKGMSLHDLEEHLQAWIDEHPGPVLILTDIGFGSCCQAARRVSRDDERVGIVAGVNLPTLLAVLRSRDLDDLRTTVRHVAERARESVEAYIGGGPA